MYYTRVTINKYDYDDDVFTRKTSHFVFFLLLLEQET